jgi:hypothetical protein
MTRERFAGCRLRAKKPQVLTRGRLAGNSFRRPFALAKIYSAIDAKAKSTFDNMPQSEHYCKNGKDARFWDLRMFCIL